MEAAQKKRLGQVGGGCGCLMLVAIFGWMCFLVYVGLEGRGNDEEASLMLGAGTCVCTVPILLLTGAGLYFGFMKKDEAPAA